MSAIKFMVTKEYEVDTSKMSLQQIHNTILNINGGVMKNSEGNDIATESNLIAAGYESWEEKGD